MYRFYDYAKYYNYPENLFRAILDSDDEKYTSDIGDRLISVIQNDEIFPDRSKDILKLYFSDGLALKEISKIHDITTGRITQIILKELRKLRMRERMSYINNGGFSEYKSRNYSSRNVNGVDSSNGLFFWTVNGISMVFIKHDKMKVRIERAMTRKGIKTFDEILKLNSRKELYDIRGIGNAAITRIMEYFEHLGIDVDKFKEPWE